MSTQPTMPGHDAPFDEKVRWLLATHAYCPWLHKIVKLYEPEGVCLRSWSVFRVSFLSWNETSIGPRGGTRTTYATEVWSHHKDRLTIEGIANHPGRSFPLFEEDGKLFKNTRAEVRT